MYIVESILFSLIIAALNYFYSPLSFLFMGEAVNPYQVLCLFMAIRYGSVKGFFSLLIIIATGCAAGVIHGGTRALLETNSIYFILSVVLTSHIAGQLRDYQVGEFYFLKKKYDRMELDFQKCTINNLMLTDANKELTQKIVSRFQSLSTVYEAAQKLETLSMEKLFPAALEILENHVGVKTAALYSIDDDKMEMKAFIGEDGNAKSPGEINSVAADWMVSRAIKLRRTVSQRENLLKGSDAVEDAERMNHLVVAPINFDGKIGGVIIVDDINFENFTDSTVRMISMISDWTGLCVNKIENFIKIESELPIDQTINCYKIDHIKKMVRTEVMKAVRYRLQLSICRVLIKNHARIVEEMKRSVYLTIGYIIKNSIRDIDVYGACIENGVFIIILPVTDSKGAAILLSRLMKEIDNFKIKPYGADDSDLKVETSAHSLFDILTEEKIKSIPFEKLRIESEKVYETLLVEMKI